MNRLRSNPLPVARLRDAIHSELDAVSDADLLERFARYADHAAFEVLLRRHGPMVYGVCRRVLADTDAEDAFQATFLVLIRKARSIRGGDRLGPWLYGVACRVAMNARSRRTRFAPTIAEAAEMIADPTVPTEIPDWLPILDAELAALPAKYRDALVLCELQGATRAEAARALGLREGTLSSRLARGRELLRKRLLKHGTLLPMGGLAALFSSHSVGRATIPLALFTQMAELAKVATGSATGVVPVGTARLTDEVLTNMFLNKLRATVGAALAMVLVAVGVTAAALPAGAPGPSPQEKGITKGVALPPTPPVSPSTPAAKKQIDRGTQRALQEVFPVPFADTGVVVSDRDALQGLWTFDRPKSGEAKIEKIQFLVVGDIWWEMERHNERADLVPLVAKIDSTKNPKWIDIGDLGPKSENLVHGIYELSGDKLRIGIVDGANKPRAAEFAQADDVSLTVLEFRREKLPPPAGEKALLGSWGEADLMAQGDGKAFRVSGPRLEILDAYLFAAVPSDDAGSQNSVWIGGRYTIDATKNPKWIDVELAAPFEDGKITKVYGCYEVAEGRVKMALGASGKRLLRPLELKASDNVLYFDLGRATKPLTGLRVTTDPIIPPATPKRY